MLTSIEILKSKHSAFKSVLKNLHIKMLDLLTRVLKLQRKVMSYSNQFPRDQIHTGRLFSPQGISLFNIFPRD